MGGATVLMTAGCENLPDNVKAIVADCAFTSPDEIFSHVLKKDYKLPKFPIMKINEAICKARAGYGFTDYSTIDAMKHAPCPIMFIHGSDNKFVPTWMSEKNYEDCKRLNGFLKPMGRLHAAVIGATSYNYIVSWFGTSLGGNTVVPLDAQLVCEDICELLNRADVSVFFYDPRFSEMLDKIKAACPAIHTYICLGETEEGLTP